MIIVLAIKVFLRCIIILIRGTTLCKNVWKINCGYFLAGFCIADMEYGTII